MMNNKITLGIVTITNILIDIFIIFIVVNANDVNIIFRSALLIIWVLVEVMSYIDTWRIIKNSHKY